jgi:hypothetical protein
MIAREDVLQLKRMCRAIRVGHWRDSLRCFAVIEFEDIPVNRS